MVVVRTSSPRSPSPSPSNESYAAKRPVPSVLRTMPRSPSPARSPRSLSRSRSPRSRSRSPIGPDTVRVMKLTKNVTTLHLEEIFDVYGRILDIDLPIVQRLGTHKGTAWITFASPAAAAKAADYMDGGQIDGSIVTVVLDEASSPPRGGGAKRVSVSPYRERRGSGESCSGSSFGPEGAWRDSRQITQPFEVKESHPPLSFAKETLSELQSAPFASSGWTERSSSRTKHLSLAIT
ncbi:putative RNA binding protein [Rhodotorula toruloides]|nr:putative RNA binding protein [Rhodotorula toruloides]